MKRILYNFIFIIILISISVCHASEILDAAREYYEEASIYYSKLSNCETMEYKNLLDTMIYGREDTYCHFASGLQDDNTFFMIAITL